MTCARCGARGPGVVVCPHVLAGWPSAHGQVPTGEAPGWQLCAACCETGLEHDDLTRLCVACVERLDLLKRL
jgi:hypothetical protein